MMLSLQSYVEFFCMQTFLTTYKIQLGQLSYVKCYFDSVFGFDSTELNPEKASSVYINPKKSKNEQCQRKEAKIRV